MPFGGPHCAAKLPRHSDALRARTGSLRAPWNEFEPPLKNSRRLVIEWSKSLLEIPKRTVIALENMRREADDYDGDNNTLSHTYTCMELIDRN
jgi:hypothetical protein